MTANSCNVSLTFSSAMMSVHHTEECSEHWVCSVNWGGRGIQCTLAAAQYTDGPS